MDRWMDNNNNRFRFMRIRVMVGFCLLSDIKVMRKATDTNPALTLKRCM